MERRQGSKPCRRYENKTISKMKKQPTFYLLLLLTGLSFFGNVQKAQKKTTTSPKYGSNAAEGKYFSTGGIKLYYETYGQGKPLLLIQVPLIG